MNDTCMRCDEPIEGRFERVNTFEGPRRVHVECRIRMVIGGLNHLTQRCFCCGGAEPPDPPDMTRREAALAAVLYWRWQQRQSA